MGYPETCCYDGYPRYTDGNLQIEPAHNNGSNADGRTELPSVTPSYERNYNSILTVDPSGRLLAHYRKTNLFYTDASWSWPNPHGFGKEAVELPLDMFPLSKKAEFHRGTSVTTTTPTSFAICMDFNPSRFTAPWDDYELATHIKDSNSRLLVACNAWLTNLSRDELQHQSEDPDESTITYWITRLKPLIDSEGGWRNPIHEGQMSKTRDGERNLEDQLTYQANVLKFSDGDSAQERICVIANRTGVEPGEVKACDLSRGRPPTKEEEARDAQESIRAQVSAEMVAAAEGKVGEGTEPTASNPTEDAPRTQGAAAPEARYAGSSCVIGLRGDNSIRMYGGLGRAENKLLVVDTDRKPQWVGRLARPEEHNH